MVIRERSATKVFFQKTKSIPLEYFGFLARVPAVNCCDMGIGMNYDKT